MPEILSIAVDILTGIKDIIEIITDIEDIDATEHEAESNFTQGVVLQLGESYPTWNAIVVTSDEDYNFTFNDYVYAHQECDIGLGFTKGYNIYICWTTEHSSSTEMADLSTGRLAEITIMRMGTTSPSIRSHPESLPSLEEWVNNHRMGSGVYRSAIGALFTTLSQLHNHHSDSTDFCIIVNA
jgi:hypothetical protein